SRKASHPAIVVRAQGSQANIIGNDNVFVLILKPEKIFPLERLAKPHKRPRLAVKLRHGSGQKGNVFLSGV
ncbi:MAG: hypothetical protein J5483_07215, partial [Lachnospiraceae bacterium]|nr:hypothetical protein [Lachnospiraceae bacterium]